MYNPILRGQYLHLHFCGIADQIQFPPSAMVEIQNLKIQEIQHLVA